MIKKWISICLIVFLLVSAIPAQTAGRTADLAEAHGLFDALGIVSLKADTKAAVTRAEFSYYLARLFMADSLLEGIENPFADCSELDDNKKGAIGFLLAQGAVSLDTEFRPNEIILVCEALKMTVCMAANEYLAEEGGGWSGGYRHAANRAGLLRGVLGGDEEMLNLGEAINLLFNALECPEIFSYSSNGKTYAQTTERPLREAYLKLYKEEGIITDNGITSLYAHTAVRTNEFVVNDMVFLDDNSKGAGMLGYDVTVYYTKTDYGNEVVYVYGESTANQTLNLYSSDIISYRNGVYTYTYDEFSEKEIKTRLADDYILIYNNYAVYDSSAYRPECMHPESGAVRLLDNNGDGRYEIVFTEAYETWQISDVDTRENIIYGKAKVYAEESRKYVEELRSIDLDDADIDYEFYDDTGAALTVTSVMKRENVISVAESLNGDYVKIILNKVNGMPF